MDISRISSNELQNAHKVSNLMAVSKIPSSELLNALKEIS